METADRTQEEGKGVRMCWQGTWTEDYHAVGEGVLIL